MHIISHRKAQQITKIKRTKKLEITYSPLGSGRWGWGRCLPLVAMILLERGASVSCLGMGGLDLATTNLLVERALVEGGRVFSRTMLPMGGRPPFEGTIFDQTPKTSTLFLADLGLADLEAKPFFVEAGRFTTFTLFS